MNFSVNKEVCEHASGQVAILQLCGNVDTQSVSTLEAIFDELYQAQIYRIVFDLSKTESINSSGLGLIINITHQLETVGGGIRMINVSDKHKVLFDLLGLQDRLVILADKKEALASY